MSLVIESGRKKEPFWVKYIRSRISKKKNFLGFISGPTGSGKSWAGLSICHQIDPDFGPERIVTSMRQLMRLINSGKLKSGSCILWDEAGIDISSKNWQSLTNKLINFLMQTFRHQRFILVFTSPHLDFIDASTRKLFHAELQTQSIDYNARTTKLKPYLIQYNSRNRKFYYKYLRVRTLHRGVAPLKYWHVPKPPQWLIEAYEEIKNQFTMKLNQDIEKQLDEIEANKSKKPQDKRELTPIQQEVMQLSASLDDVEAVAQQLGITTRSVYFHISQSKKKGWKIEDFVAKKGDVIDIRPEI